MKHAFKIFWLGFGLILIGGFAADAQYLIGLPILLLGGAVSFIYAPVSLVMSLTTGRSLTDKLRQRSGDNSGTGQL